MQAQATYATEAVAVTPAQAEELRRSLAGILGHKRGMCNASLMALHGQADPVADFRWRQVKDWIAL